MLRSLFVHAIGNIVKNNKLDDMADIRLSIEGGEAKTFPAGTTAAEAIKALCSSKERKSTVAVRAGDRMLDLSEPLTADAVLAPVSKDSREGLDILRHSASHIMAQAVVELYGP